MGSATKSAQSKFFLEASFTGTGNIGNSGPTTPSDIRAERILRCKAEGVGAPNSITVYGRIHNAAAYESLGTISGTTAVTIDTSVIDEVYFDCTVYNASGSPKLLVSGFFEDASGGGGPPSGPAGGDLTGTYPNPLLAGPILTGTRASPSSITAAGGVTAGTNVRQVQFLKSNGGAVNITANPQISAGTTVGTRLSLIGRSDTDTLLFENGTGLALNGSCLLKADSVLNLLWDGTNWLEESRNDI